MYRAGRDGTRAYFWTVKPCSVPYLTEASCQFLSPPDSLVPETLEGRALRPPRTTDGDRWPPRTRARRTRHLRERGRVIPGDVSVIGFDNIPEAGSCMPPLTTVHQDFAEVGRLCVEGVLRRMRHDEAEHGTTLVPTRLVVRDSTAPPPAGK